MSKSSALEPEIKYPYLFFKMEAVANIDKELTKSLEIKVKKKRLVPGYKICSLNIDKLTCN